jgi:hypothetical protein
LNVLFTGPGAFCKSSCILFLEFRFARRSVSGTVPCTIYYRQ